MMNKRLIDFVPESRKYIAGNVALQWVSLLANIGMMTAITQLLAALFCYVFLFKPGENAVVVKAPELGIKAAVGARHDAERGHRRFDGDGAAAAEGIYEGLSAPVTRQLDH